LNCRREVLQESLGLSWASGDNGAVPHDRQPVRFGIFEVNLDTGEVRRAGVKVRLQEQPFQVLAALLEKPGEIVAKEELQERIWKDDTYVDFDRSLATAINKVRQALGDSAPMSRMNPVAMRRMCAVPDGAGVAVVSSNGGTHATNWLHYDVFPDGQRFVAGTSVPSDGTPAVIRLAENWHEKFRNR